MYANDCFDFLPNHCFNDFKIFPGYYENQEADPEDPNFVVSIYFDY